MHGSIRVGLMATAGAVALLGSALTTTPAAGRTVDTERVSVASNGAGGDQASYAADISPDGRYVVFLSQSQNLVPGDFGWAVRTEVYLHDRVRHTTEQVSPERTSSSADGFHVRNPVVSAGGRFVAFDTAADDLPADDDDIEGDVFMWDRQAGRTSLVSTPPVAEGEQSASRYADMSDDGGVVAYTAAIFEEDPAAGIDRAIYAFDRQTQSTSLVFEVHDTGRGGGAELSPPTLSADGRYVAFRTSTGYGTDSASSSVLLHDRTTGQTEMVTEHGGAAVPGEAPAVSADGRFVAFASSSDELVPGDDDGDVDVFVHDRSTGSTELVSVGDDGRPGDGDSTSPSISADGRHVVFHSDAPLSTLDTDRLPDVYAFDRDTDRTTLVTKALAVDPQSDDRWNDAGSYDASIDGEGRHVAFSTMDRLSDGRDTNRITDVYVHDLLGGSPSTGPSTPCTDRTSASVTCGTDSRGRLVLKGTAFDERLFGTGRADVLRGARGSDVLVGRAGPDRLFGGAGRDLLRPGAGRDVVDCGTARDRVLGARGDRVRRDCEVVRRG